MIKSVIFSAVTAALVVLGVGNYVHGWFLQGYNWLWLAIPSFWLAYKAFSKIFKVLDIILLIAIIILIIYMNQHGIGVPSL